MKLLADENVRRRLVQWLQGLGHDVVTAPKGFKNSRLVELCKKEGRALLTNDTDFLNTALYPPASSPGKIVLRVFPDTLAGQQASLSLLLSKIKKGDLSGKLIELQRDKFEIHSK